MKRRRFLLNEANQKISLFPIAEGETIECGDLVVVNTRTMQASKPKKESGYHAVGRAIEIVNKQGTQMVICKDGIFFIENTKIPENRILDSDYGRVCYFEGTDSVTLDNINTTKAGEILGIQKTEDEDENENEYVLVKISTDDGGEIAW